MKDESQRPWGHYEILLDTDYCKVKRIFVKPARRLSYQSHRYRQENWTIVSGRAAITLDGELHYRKAGESIFIPLGSKHRVSNEGDEDLVFIEVQTGTYFGEDDITRFEDDFNRA